MSILGTTTSNFVYNPAAQYLFNRTYALAIGAPNQTSAIQFSNIAQQNNGQIMPAAPLRVSFDIDKRMAGTSNKSKISIWNLSATTRNIIKSGYLLNLKAGYRGLMDTIFVGNIDLKGAKTERHGADLITSFECGEGESAIVMSRFDKSYPPGATLAQVLQDVSNAMSLSSVTNDAGVAIGQVVGLPQQTYPRGLTVQGACRDTLDKLLKPQGMRWCVHNGSLVIIPLDATNQQQAILVASGSVTDPISGISIFNPNQATGLIGVPTNQTGQLLEFTSLLNPKIVPGALIQLVCANTSINGYYKILRAHYEGDSHDNRWQVSCEAIPIGGQAQALPTASGSNFSAAQVTA